MRSFNWFSRELHQIKHELKAIIGWYFVCLFANNPVTQQHSHGTNMSGNAGGFCSLHVESWSFWQSPFKPQRWIKPKAHLLHSFVFVTGTIWELSFFPDYLCIPRIFCFMSAFLPLSKWKSASWASQGYHISRLCRSHLCRLLFVKLCWSWHAAEVENYSRDPLIAAK